MRSVFGWGLLMALAPCCVFVGCSSGGGDDDGAGAGGGAGTRATSGGTGGTSKGGSGGSSGGAGAAGDSSQGGGEAVPLTDDEAQAITDFLALGPDEQLARVNELDGLVERELFVYSGLEDELGGPQTTDEQWAAALAGLDGIVAQAVSDATPADLPAAREIHPFANTGEVPSLAGALMGGLMFNGLVGQAIVEASNRGGDGELSTDNVTVKADLAHVSMALDALHVTAEGLSTKLNQTADMTPCPNDHGVFLGSAHITMSETAGSVGQTGQLDVVFEGQLDDNADVAGLDVNVDVAMADFASAKGQFIDLSYRFGMAGSKTPFSQTLTRYGGAPTEAWLGQVQTLGILMGMMLTTQLKDAMEAGWKSGRCVQLNVSTDPAQRSGVDPNAKFKITAQPRSKTDGGSGIDAPTGGTVTATLVGGANVDPSGTPVPADAEFDYLAPSETAMTGSVSLEARSKRGIGTASVDFSTGAAYTASGGSAGISISGTVADLTQPFTLDGTFDGGTMVLTYLPDADGRSGTFTNSGSASGFTLSGTGTYVITGDDGGPLTLTEMGNGCVDTNCSTHTEVITLTPVGG